MSNVLSFFADAGADAGPKLPARMRLLSRALSVVLTGFAVVMGTVATAIIVSMFLYNGHIVEIGRQGMELNLPGDAATPGYVALGSLPFDNKLVYVLVGLLRIGPSVLVLLNLAALFRLYGRGEVFGQANALRLKNVGLWLVIDGVMPLICHTVLSLTPYEVDKHWLHLESFQELIIGALVFVIAAVMQIGRAIEEERSQFI